MEKTYIEQRKKHAEELSTLFKRMQKYPINHNKVVFSAYEGDGGFCCNPKYIAIALHNKYPNMEMVWLVKKTDKDFPEYITPVEYTDENIAYHLSTAKIWVDNYRKPYGSIKRPEQIYIQTWHASLGFKAVGLFRGDLFPEIARIVSEWDSAMIDYVVSNSQYCDNVYPKKLLYNGPTIRCGSPRVDSLINERDFLYTKIREKYDIDEDVKIMMYAPTFRGGNNNGKKNVIAEVSSLDFDKAIKVLEEKSGAKWKVFLRLHPQLAAKLDAMPIEEDKDYFVDVSQADDISELLGAVDLLVTDYSSCAFDAAFAHIPVLLYADDVNEYIGNRGKFMWGRDELPFLMAETNHEFLENIRSFNNEVYKEKIDQFMLINGVVEEGKAAIKIVDFLHEKIYKQFANGDNKWEAVNGLYQ